MGMTFALSGCLQDAATLSSFSDVSASGFIDSGLDNPGGVVVRDTDGSGDAFAAGRVTGSGLKATSGIINGSTVAQPPSAGTARFDGTYQLYRTSIIDFDLSSITGYTTRQSGNIALNVNFGAGTISGSDGSLSVDGRFRGTSMSGDVTYEGVDGDLTGLVGSDRAIGAFHGNDADLIYAGGFIDD